MSLLCDLGESLYLEVLSFQLEILLLRKMLLSGGKYHPHRTAENLQVKDTMLGPD